MSASGIARWLRGALLAGVVSTLGCVINDPPLPPSPPVPEIPGWEVGATEAFVPEDEELELWEDGEEAAAALENAEWIYDDPKLDSYLATIVDALLAGELPPGVPAPQVRVVRVTGQQAVVFANGSIYIALSLLAIIENEAQLAALLGHELAHFLMRDLLVKKRYALLTRSTVERMELARSIESDADRIAVDLMHRAGYDPEQMIFVLEHLKKADAVSRGPTFAWESHPYISERVLEVEKQIRKLTLPEKIGGSGQYSETIADVLVHAAELEFEEGLTQRGERTLARHLLLRPQSARGHYVQAEQARRTETAGRNAPAVRKGYERALELDPNEPDVLRALGRLLIAGGEAERGRALLQRYLDAYPEAFDRKLVEREVRESGRPHEPRS